MNGRDELLNGYLIELRTHMLVVDEALHNLTASFNSRSSMPSLFELVLLADELRLMLFYCWRIAAVLRLPVEKKRRR